MKKVTLGAVFLVVAVMAFSTFAIAGIKAETANGEVVSRSVQNYEIKNLNISVRLFSKKNEGMKIMSHEFEKICKETRQVCEKVDAPIPAYKEIVINDNISSKDKRELVEILSKK